MPEYTLPPLGFDYAALEPTIDTATMQIHHGKHHQAYVNNLNAALKDYPELSNQSVDDLIEKISTVPEGIRAAVRNNGGGHANHSLFWEIMTPGGATSPSGVLAAAINSAFGDLDGLKKAVTEAGTKRFGSGWAWVVAANDGSLTVTSTPNQDSPVMEGKCPIIGVDVWEHAYYLHYQNRRPDYLSAWWSVVNWDKVAARYASAKS